MNNTTIEILKAEAKRLRMQADKIDALLHDLSSDLISPSVVSPPVANPPKNEPSLPGVGEFAGMKQKDSIVFALRKYGPQTTSQLFERLNAGGQNFKEIGYISAILHRFKDQWEKIDGKISLKLPQA